MSSLLLNSDTIIVVSDSILAKLVKTAELSQGVNDAETNSYDVLIVFIICAAIVLVALIAKWILRSWKNAELESLKEEFKNKREKEETDCMRKQKAELLGKELDILKDLCYGKIEKKEIGSPEIKKYLDTIEENLKERS